MCCSDSSPCVVQTVHHVLAVHHVLFRQFTMRYGVVQTFHHVLFGQFPTSCSDSSPRLVQTVHHVLFRQFPTRYSDSSPRLAQTVHHVLFRQFITCCLGSSQRVIRQFPTRYSDRFTTCCSESSPRVVLCTVSSVRQVTTTSWRGQPPGCTESREISATCSTPRRTTSVQSAGPFRGTPRIAWQRYGRYTSTKTNSNNRLWRHYCPSSSSHNETCNGRRGKGFKSCCCCIYC